MRNFTIYLAGFLCLFLTKVFAQDQKQNSEQAVQTFESRAKQIASKIESITKDEKAALKQEVEAVNQELEKGLITKEQADDKKMKLANERAKTIEFKVAQAQDELKDLVQQKVEGKIKEQDSTRTFVFRWDGKNKKTKDDSSGEKRTTSQLVFATGFNNLVTDNAVVHSDFKYLGSHFYEWGLSYSTRILKNNNLLHANYGMSLMYNNLRPTDSRFFVENGKQTNLAVNGSNLEDSRFRNVYLVVPAHLEFDFTKKEIKNDKTIFRTHESFRMGFGGYAGVNVKSKQILSYEDASENDVTQKTKGNFNVNDFIYGVSAYIGYDEVSLYAKYDLNPMFKNNAVDQNNISLGVRFDFN